MTGTTQEKQLPHAQQLQQKLAQQTQAMHSITANVQNKQNHCSYSPLLPCSSSNSGIVSLKAKQNKVAGLDTSSKAPTVRSYLDDFLSHIDESKHPKCYNCINSHSTNSKDNSCKSCFINECVRLLQLYAEQPKKQKIAVQLVRKFLVNAFTWKQVQPIIAPITELLVVDASNVPLFNIARYFFQIIKRSCT